MIDMEELYFAFRSCRLSEPDNAWVSLDRETGKAYALPMEAEKTPDFPDAVSVLPGETVLWDGMAWELVNVELTSIVLCSAEEKIVSVPVSSFETLVQSGAVIPSRPLPDKGKAFASAILESAGKEALEAANKRCELLQESRESSSDLSSGKTPTHTLRRWNASFRAMEQGFGNGYLGLLPRTPKRENRMSRMNESVEAFDFFLNMYRTTPKEKLLEHMTNQSDIELLRSLSQEDLAEICSERFAYGIMLKK